jgi:hypothetical protein
MEALLRCVYPMTGDQSISGMDCLEESGGVSLLS